MVILDEQLIGRGVNAPIAAWYAGSVSTIKDLRPGTVIKDDAIPMLLAQARNSTFITINENDFWQVFPADGRFCLVCFAVPSRHVVLIPDLLRRLLRHADFDTKAKRMEKVARVTQSGAVSFYDTAENTTRDLGII